MPIHHADQELWLGHIEVGLSPFALHEASRLVPGPSALSFVKHNNFLVRDGIVADVVVSEVMNILDKTADFALSYPFRDALTRRFVACEGFSKDIDKRAIAGQKNGVLITVPGAPFLASFARSGDFDRVGRTLLSFAFDVDREVDRVERAFSPAPFDLGLIGHAESPARSSR